MMTSAPSFFFNDAAATEIYTLSLHAALPELAEAAAGVVSDMAADGRAGAGADP